MSEDHPELLDPDLAWLAVLVDEDKQPRSPKQPTINPGCFWCCVLLSAVAYFVWLFAS